MSTERQGVRWRSLCRSHDPEWGLAFFGPMYRTVKYNYCALVPWGSKAYEGILEVGGGLLIGSLAVGAGGRVPMLR